MVQYVATLPHYLSPAVSADGAVIRCPVCQNDIGANGGIEPGRNLYNIEGTNSSGKAYCRDLPPCPVPCELLMPATHVVHPCRCEVSYAVAACISQAVAARKHGQPVPSVSLSPPISGELQVRGQRLNGTLQALLGLRDNKHKQLLCDYWLVAVYDQLHRLGLPCTVTFPFATHELHPEVRSWASARNLHLPGTSAAKGWPTPAALDFTASVGGYGPSVKIPKGYKQKTAVEAPEETPLPPPAAPVLVTKDTAVASAPVPKEILTALHKSLSEDAMPVLLLLAQVFKRPIGVQELLGQLTGLLSCVAVGSTGTLDAGTLSAEFQLFLQHYAAYCQGKGMSGVVLPAAAPRPQAKRQRFEMSLYPRRVLRWNRSL